MPATQRFEPKSLQPRHRNIMRLQLANFNKKEIAEMVGLSEAAVGYITNSDIYKSELSKLEQEINTKLVDEALDVRKEISALSKKAILELKAILYNESANPKLKADVAFDILDRDGFAAPEERRVTIEWTDAVKKAHARRKELKLVKNGEKVIPLPGWSEEPKQLETSEPEKTGTD
jgi:predicted transcriptional regulator